MAKTLGDYLFTDQVENALNFRAADNAYMVLITAPDGDRYGVEIEFACELGRAHSGADWADTMGRGAIVVDLSDMLRLAWTDLPVVYDTDDEEFRSDRTGE